MGRRRSDELARTRPSPPLLRPPARPPSNKLDPAARRTVLVRLRACSESLLEKTAVGRGKGRMRRPSCLTLDPFELYDSCTLFLSFLLLPLSPLQRQSSSQRSGRRLRIDAEVARTSPPSEASLFVERDLAPNKLTSPSFLPSPSSPLSSPLPKTQRPKLTHILPPCGRPWENMGKLLDPPAPVMLIVRRGEG